MLDIIVPTIKTAAEVAPLIAEIERTAGCSVRVRATCTSGSASQNRNIGLEWATSDIIVMMDDDVERLPQGWAQRMVDVMRQHPECAMASPQLSKPDGTPGVMMGGVRVQREGITAARERKLPTACVAVRRNGLRFDEHFTGSGFEDDDYCAQLREAHPGCTFLVVHDLWLVHRNEMKNQHGPYWEPNKAYFERKWLQKRTEAPDRLGPIWAYWEGPRPAYIDLCLDTIRHHCRDLDLRVLDLAAWKKIISPVTVSANWRKITNRAVQADVVRASLLAVHGGLWIDADTVMLRSPRHLITESPVEYMVWTAPPFRILNGYVYVRPGSPVGAAWLANVNRFLNANNFGWTVLGEKSLTPAVLAEPAAVRIPLATWLPVEIDNYGVRAFYAKHDPQTFLRPETVAFGLNHSDFNNYHPEIVNANRADVVKGDTLLARVLRLGMEKMQ